MDDSLPMTLFDFWQCFVWCLASVCLTLATNYWVLLAVVPLLYQFSKLRAFSLLTSREVKRLDALSRSPIYSLLGEALDGLVTIRAFGRAAYFQAVFMDRVNANTRAYFAFISTSRWLGYRLDAQSFALLTAVTLAGVGVYEANRPVVGFDPSLVGLSLLYVIQLSGLGQWTVRQSAELENQMVSVERVLTYTKLNREASLDSPTPAVTPWPSLGALSVENLVVSHRSDLPPTLKGISFSVAPGERFGIVGRSGSGNMDLI